MCVIYNRNPGPALITTIYYTVHSDALGYLAYALFSLSKLPLLTFPKTGAETSYTAVAII